MAMTITTDTAEKTQELAREVAQQLLKRDLPTVIALKGEMGAGKTTFVQGLAKGLGIEAHVLSPTFILMRQYPIPNTEKQLYHLDLYRLEDPELLNQLGLEDLFTDPKAIVVIEWPEIAEIKLPQDTINISIISKDELTREIQITSLKLPDVA